MRVILKLVKRNTLNYLYDKTSVFFSFLSVLIIIFLYAAFLAQIQVDNITSLVGEISGIRWLVDSWILAGVITVNTITVPLTILSDMISDIERGYIDDFLAAPISRKQIVLGYLVTSWIVGIVISIFTIFIGQIYVLIAGGELFSFIAYVKIIGIVILSVISFSSISYFVMTFMKTISAVSVLNTLTGTLIGFLAGIYLPIGMFQNVIQFIVKVNPASHVASSLRKVMMVDPLSMVFKGAPESAVESYRSFYGVDLSVNGFEINTGIVVVYLIIVMMIFFGLSVLRIKSIRK